TIVPLTKAESYAYIRACLAYAALPGRPIFTRGALTCLVRAARGVPRLLASLCTQALITGCDRRQRPITARLVRDLVRAGGPRATPARRWPLGLAIAAGLLLVTGGLWLTLHGPLQRATVPESPQPLAPAETQVPRHVQEPLTGSPSPQTSLENTAISPRETSELPLPSPSEGPASVPPSLPTGEVRQEAASSSSTGETTNASAATPVGEPQPPPMGGAAETQAALPQGEDTTAARLPRTVIMKRGDSLWKLALKTYGFVDARLLQRIHKQNPHLKNLDVIAIDTKLVLPALE